MLKMNKANISTNEHKFMIHATKLGTEQKKHVYGTLLIWNSFFNQYKQFYYWKTKIGDMLK